MRSGRMRHRVTFLKRSGIPVEWEECCTLSAAFTVPKGAQSGGLAQIGGVGLRRNMPFLVMVHENPVLQAGLLMRCGERYWSVDSVANQNERGREYVLTCREFVGLPATYYDASNDDTYACRAAPIHSNVEAQFSFRTDVATIKLELLLIELRWPYLQKNDRITVQGVEHLIDGSPITGYDGYTAEIDTLHTPPAVANY